MMDDEYEFQKALEGLEAQMLPVPPASLTDDLGVYCSAAGRDFAYKLADTFQDDLLNGLLRDGQLAIVYRILDGGGRLDRVTYPVDNAPFSDLQPDVASFFGVMGTQFAAKGLDVFFDSELGPKLRDGDLRIVFRFDNGNGVLEAHYE